MHTRSSVQRFRNLIASAYQRFNALQRGEKRCFGVTMSQCFTLELLHENEALTVRELAQRLGLDTSTVTRTIDVLVRDGLVRRQRNEHGDRRQVLLALTTRGRSLARRLMGCADAYCERIVDQIPHDRVPDVVHALELLVAALDDMQEAGSKAA